MSRAGGAVEGGAREGRRESPPQIHAGPGTSSHNLIPSLPKSGLATTFFFSDLPTQNPAPYSPSAKKWAPGPAPGRVVRPRGEDVGGASLGAGRGSRRVGARRSRRKSGVGAPAPTEPAGPPPLPRGGKPTEEWTDCRGNGRDGRDGLKGRDRARTGRETTRSGSGSSPCRGGLGAETG